MPVEGGLLSVFLVVSVINDWTRCMCRVRLPVVRPCLCTGTISINRETHTRNRKGSPAALRFETCFDHNLRQICTAPKVGGFYPQIESFRRDALILSRFFNSKAKSKRKPRQTGKIRHQTSDFGTKQWLGRKHLAERLLAMIIYSHYDEYYYKSHNGDVFHTMFLQLNASRILS